MIINGQPKDHSGVGRFWGNLLMTVVSFLVFCGCLYAMGFWDLETVWVPGLLAMGLAVLAFLIPKQLLGRSDSVDQKAIHAEQAVTRVSGH